MWQYDYEKKDITPIVDKGIRWKILLLDAASFQEMKDSHKEFEKWLSQY